MMKKTLALVSILILVAFSGCNSKNVKSNSKQPAKAAVTTTAAITTQAAVTTAAAVTTQTAVTTETAVTNSATTESGIVATNAGILVTIGNEVITEEDVAIEFENLPEQYKQYYQTEDGKKKILENLINQKILKLVAIKDGIDNDAEFKKDMSKLTERVLANYAVKRNILDKVKATDAELEAKYNEVKEQYKTGEEVKASHILLMFKEGMNDVDKKALYTKIEGILKEINDGKDFGELAKANSDDGSGANGGSLGWFAKGVMVKPFEDACFTGEVGKVYPTIVETQFGYHIIKVDEKKPASYKSLEEIKDKLSEDIVASKRNESFAKWMEELKKEYIK